MINPNFKNVYINRGIAKVELQDYTGAIVDFNKEIEINPNKAEYVYELYNQFINECILKNNSILTKLL